MKMKGIGSWEQDHCFGTNRHVYGYNHATTSPWIGYKRGHAEKNDSLFIGSSFTIHS
jgi:hypothetical protein